MKRVTPFRVASALLVIFCAMHTAGGMLSESSLGPDADAVFAAMKRVHFDFNGSDATWYVFWFGFGLTASVFLLLSAVVAWELDRVPDAVWPRVQVISWALIAGQAINTAISWRYFFAGPAGFGVVVTGLLVFGTLRKNAASKRGPATT